MMEAQPKKSWVAITVEGARPSAKAKTTPFPKTSEVPTPVPKAGNDQALRAVEVKKEGETMLPAIAGARLRNLREKESLAGVRMCLRRSQRSREASKRPDDVDSRPGAAAREASGDDLHSALGILGKGRGSALDSLQGNGEEA